MHHLVVSRLCSLLLMQSSLLNSECLLGLGLLLGSHNLLLMLWVVHLLRVTATLDLLELHSRLDWHLPS